MFRCKICNSPFALQKSLDMHAADTGHDQLSSPPGKVSRFAQHSPLLEHLDQRFKALGLGEDKPYRKPAHIVEANFEAAANAHAKAHLSDPHAGKRIRLHMRQGYALVSEVLADATRILQNREAARRVSA